MIHENELIGMPLKKAAMLCEKNGLVVIKTSYAAPKPLAGATDARVIRAKWQGDNIELIYSIFTTDIDI